LEKKLANNPSFYRGYTVDDNDLTVTFTSGGYYDISGLTTYYSPYWISYEVGWINPDTLVYNRLGPLDRVPLNTGVGRFYANFVIGLDWPIATYQIRWKYKVSDSSAVEYISNNFTVIPELSSGLTGIDGINIYLPPTGVQGVPVGSTGLGAVTGTYYFTGPPGATGAIGYQGETGIQGVTGVLGSLDAISFYVYENNAVITTGEKSHVYVPYNGTITNWEITTSETGMIYFDVWKDTYSNYPFTSSNSIIGNSSVGITGAIKGTGEVSGWYSTTVSPGDYIKLSVTGVSEITKVLFVMKINKS
jgi:hypothetical protein